MVRLADLQSTPCSRYLRSSSNVSLALLLPMELLRLRVANKQLADRTVHVFTARFLQARVWRAHKTHHLERKPRFLESSLSSIKHLRWVCDYEQGYTESTERLINAINSLLNLRSLELHGLWNDNPGYKLALKKLRLPRLEVLVFDNCQFYQDIMLVSEVSNSHNQTLKSFKLRDLNDMRDFNIEASKTWINLLEAAKTLGNQAVVEILDPTTETLRSSRDEVYVHISFLPLPNLAAISDDATVIALIGGKYGRSTNYRTEDGNLHKSLNSMIRNYKVFDSWDDMMASEVAKQFNPLKLDGNDQEELVQTE